MKKIKGSFWKRIVFVYISMVICFVFWLFWSFADDGFMFAEGPNRVPIEIEKFIVFLWFLITLLIAWIGFGKSEKRDNALLIGILSFLGVIMVGLDVMTTFSATKIQRDNNKLGKEMIKLEKQKETYKINSEVIYDINSCKVSIYFDNDNKTCYWIDFSDSYNKRISEINMFESRITKDELLSTYAIAYRYNASNNSIIYLIKDNIDDHKYIERIYIEYNGKLYVGSTVDAIVDANKEQTLLEYDNHDIEVTSHLRNTNKDKELILKEAESIYDFGNNYEKLVLNTNDSIMYHINDTKVKEFWVQKRKLNLDDFIFLKLNKELKTNNGLIKVYEYTVSEINDKKIQVIYWLYNGESYFIISNKVLIN